METKTISPQDERWLAFINMHPSATFFHHPVWIQFLADVYHYQPFVLSVLDPTGKIVAGIPFVKIKQITTRKRLVALPFTDHCSPLYVEGLKEDIFGALSSLYRETGADEMEVRWSLPAIPSMQYESTFVLHTLDLEAESNHVLSKFQPANRRNLKTALKSGIRIERGTDEAALRQYYELHLETRRRQGVPIQPWRFFKLLGKELLENGYGFILLAYQNGDCIAGSVFLHWRDKLIYKFGASLESSLHYRPNNLVMWTAIQWGCENGYTQFDFGRTDFENEGLRRFKAGFGAIETPLDYSILSKLPISKRDHLLNIMRIFIQHSPPWVCRVAGEALYRFAG